MELPTYFADFLREIRLTKTQIDDLKTGHHTLRERLEADEELAPIFVSTFLQGSYRRGTALRPKGDKRADVDVIVVTRLDRQKESPADAMRRFIPFLERHYKGKYEPQDRSFGIHLSYVDLDLVITSAPAEVESNMYKAASVLTESTLEDVPNWKLAESWGLAEATSGPAAMGRVGQAVREAEWKPSPLYIPDREVREWEATHPLAQIQWTREKNRRCNGHYVNVVKAIKWWRLVRLESLDYPKGYPVEHMVGACCPDGIESVGEGVTRALEEIAILFASNAAARSTPYVADHGVSQNVFRRVSGRDFATFHEAVCKAAKVSRRALDLDDVTESAETWRHLFGDRFPEPPESGGEDDPRGSGPRRGGYTPRKEATIIGGGRYA
jgi:hypothetical protein